MSAKDRTARCGIYQIRCIPTGKVYIGSAVDIPARWRRHRHALSRGAHHSVHLQRAWQKHGADQFAFEVLEAVVDKDKLVRVEQEWLDRIRPFDEANGFNISPIAGSKLGIRLSPEARAKMAAERREDAEFLAKMSMVAKNRSPQHRAKLSAAASLRNRKRPPELMARVTAAAAAANKGRKFSDEHRSKLAAAAVKREAAKRARAAVHQSTFSFLD
jgi:group I intron endonuclease